MNILMLYNNRYSIKLYRSSCSRLFDYLQIIILSVTNVIIIKILFAEHFGFWAVCLSTLYIWLLLMYLPTIITQRIFVFKNKFIIMRFPKIFKILKKHKVLKIHQISDEETVSLFEYFVNGIWSYKNGVVYRIILENKTYLVCCDKSDIEKMKLLILEITKSNES